MIYLGHSDPLPRLTKRFKGEKPFVRICNALDRTHDWLHPKTSMALSYFDMSDPRHGSPGLNESAGY